LRRYSATTIRSSITGEVVIGKELATVRVEHAEVVEQAFVRRAPH